MLTPKHFCCGGKMHRIVDRFNGKRLVLWWCGTCHRRAVEWLR